MEVLTLANIVLCSAGGVEKPLPQRQRNRSLLFQIPQELPVQRARVAEVLPHPIRRRSGNTVADSQGVLRGCFLEFVGQRVVVAPVGVMEKASGRTQKIHRGGAHLFLGRGDIANSDRKSTRLNS